MRGGGEGMSETMTWNGDAGVVEIDWKILNKFCAGRPAFLLVEVAEGRCSSLGQHASNGLRRNIVHCHPEFPLVNVYGFSYNCGLTSKC